MKNGKMLSAILALQILGLLTQWLGAPMTPARAQIPDAGAQQLEEINTLKSIDGKMDKLIGILESGKLQIQASKPDDSQQK